MLIHALINISHADGAESMHRIVIDECVAQVRLLQLDCDPGIVVIVSAKLLKPFAQNSGMVDGCISILRVAISIVG